MNMNACDRCRELLDRGAYIDPTADGFRNLTEHVAACPDCAKRLRECRDAECAARAFLRWADPGEGFSARVLRAVTARPERRMLRRLIPVAAAAAIVVAVFATAPFGPGRSGTVRPKRMIGEFALRDGGPMGTQIPLGSDLVVGQSQGAIEMARGVGFALRPGTRFRVEPESARGYTQLALQRGGAAVSVKTARKADKIEIGVGEFSVLASDADFLVEARTNGDEPGLYVDRGRVVVSFPGGVSVVEGGEHVPLVASRLLSRVRAGEEQIKADLAALEAQCADLRDKIVRYEELVRTYGERREKRHGELEMAQEALVAAPDDETARQLEKQVNKEMTAVENLDYVMGEHIAKVSSLRAELPARLTELRRTRAMATRQTERFREGIAALARLR